MCVVNDDGALFPQFDVCARHFRRDRFTAHDSALPRLWCFFIFPGNSTHTHRSINYSSLKITAPVTIWQELRWTQQSCNLFCEESIPFFFKEKTHNGTRVTNLFVSKHTQFEQNSKKKFFTCTINTAKGIGTVDRDPVHVRLVGCFSRKTQSRRAFWDCIWEHKSRCQSRGKQCRCVILQIIQMFGRRSYCKAINSNVCLSEHTVNKDKKHSPDVSTVGILFIILPG